MFSRVELTQRPVLINGAPGYVTLRDGKPFSLSAFTVREGRIVELDILADPDRLAVLDLGGVGLGLEN
jgi:RNA polymerase sigma-70 factor (ECF subfamily)